MTYLVLPGLGRSRFASQLAAERRPGSPSKPFGCVLAQRSGPGYRYGL